jgi:hypothetical protein
MLAVYDDCLRQKYTDLKIVCRGDGCIFHVHRLVVCTESKYLRDEVEALASGVSFPISESTNWHLISPDLIRTLTDNTTIGR